ncbi:hypothetical protein [Marmoricola sp. OAE513]|uniref:hypothetical protein n=1 Tax=Marmoricola sp. OAE513 TaxID=2817894 RepID=UPI001AE2F256
MNRARDGLAAAGGSVLSGAVAVLGAATGRIKPFHPHGQLHAARLVRRGSPRGGTPSGVAWIDEVGEDEAVVRLSGGVGLPQGWPDIHGLALATGNGAARADVLLAGTGTGTVTRHVLLPTRRASAHTLTTLLPYRAPTGPLYLGAEPQGEDFTLTWARSNGPWHAFARLEVGDVLTSGDTITFDPVLHVPQGLAQYGWVRSLREPAYAVARLRSGRSVAES